MADKLQIREALAACFEANSEPMNVRQILAWIGTHYREADFPQQAIQVQLYKSCANVNSYRPTSAPQILLYEKATRTYSRVPPGYEGDTQSILSAIEENESTEPQFQNTFALEAHLQGYLAKNLWMLEKGLEFWKVNPPSIEYWIEGRRIDILAKDTNGVPVVIELKLKTGYEQQVGQALLYQALVAKELGVPKVRLILVANEISYELRMACSRLTDVELFKYAITMKLERVSATLSEEEV